MVNLNSSVAVSITGNSTKLTSAVNSAVSSLGRLNSSANNIRSNAATINTSMARLTSNMLKFGAAMLVVRTGLRLASSAFTGSLKSVEQFNLGVASSASIVTTFSKLKPGQTLAENFKEAFGYSKAVQLKFVEINKDTVANANQMSIVNRELQKQGVFLDSNNKKQTKGFETFVNAIGVLTAGMPDANRQFGQEARAVMEGLARQGATLSLLIKKKLGDSWKDIIEEWKKGGTFFENMNDLLKGFAEGSKELTKTWKVQGSTMTSIIDDILRRGFEDTYNKIIDLVVKINEHLLEHRDEYAIKLKELWSLISIAVGEVSTLIKSMTTDSKLLNTALVLVSEALKGWALILAVINGNYRETKQLLDDLGKTERELAIRDLTKKREEEERNLANIGERIALINQQIKLQTNLNDNTVETAKTLATLFKQYGEANKNIKEYTRLIEGIQKLETVAPAVVAPESESTSIKEESKVTPEQRYKNYLKQNKVITEALRADFKLLLDAFDSMDKAWATTIDGLLAGTKSFADGIQDMGQAVVNSVRQMVAKMIAEFLKLQAINALASILDAFFPGVGTALKIVAAPKGSQLGPAFDTGTDFVPADMSAKIHKGEIIVPPKESAFLRSGKLALSKSGQENSESSAMIIAKLDDISKRPMAVQLQFGDEELRPMARQLDNASFRNKEEL